MPSIRPAWPMVRGRIVSSFCRTSIDSAVIGRIVEIFRQLQAFVAPVGRDIGGLAVEIDRVLGVDLDLPRNRFGDFGELRPDPDGVRHADVRIGQEVHRAAPLAVLVQREAMARGLVRRDRQAPGRAAAPASSASILAPKCAALAAPTQPIAMPLPVSR